MKSTARGRLLAERIARHGLAQRPATSPVTATALTTAVQAQDPAAARLGVRARATSLTEAWVLHAHDVDRTIVRTWLMRGTIHLVDTADLHWLVRLIGPAVARKFRTRWARLGLTDELTERVIELLPDVLADGPRTRHEIRVALAERGVVIESPDPQAVAHLLVHASTVGLICRGPDRGRHSTFVLVDQWLPDAPAGPSGDDALAELARRYFAAYSPATALDFGAWSGLPYARAIGLIRDELVEADVDGRPGFRLGEVTPARGVRLLPAFDNYLIGYRDRAAILEPELHHLVYQGGMIRPTVVADGRVVGTWALDRTHNRVTMHAFEELDARTRRGTHAEVEDVGRFLGRELSLAVG